MIAGQGPGRGWVTGTEVAQKWFRKMLLLLALLVYIYIGLYLPKIPKIDETLFKNIQLYQYWNRDYVLGVDYLLKVELL